MLDAAGNEGFESIVGWLPDGRSFRVHDPVTFVDKVMKKFFNQNKYKSFQRQLNIWGFVRILDGPMKGGYMHHHLAQGQPELCAMMKRQKIKGGVPVGPGTSPATMAVVAHYPPTTIDVHQNPNKQQQQQQQQQTSGMMRSTSVVSDSSSVSSDMSSLTAPMYSSEHHQAPQPVQYQQPQQQPQQQLQVYGGGNTNPTTQFEGQMFFLLGEDLPSVAPPMVESKTTTNTYRSNRRLSVQLFAASQGENTGMPGIEELFADLESGTDALDIFNRSIAC
jgi:hypothetical protein